jgi:DME family drug/metabolite transporter
MLWGTTGTAQAIAPANADPLAVGSLRLALGGLALLLIAITRRTQLRGQAWPLRPTLAAALTVATYQLCFFSGVARTGVAVGTIVGIGTAPILAGLLGWWLNAENPGRRWMLSTLLAILGCVLLLLPGQAIQIDPLGVLLAVGAGFSYAVYTRFSKTLLALHPPDAVMAVVFSLGALLLLPVLLTADLNWVTDPRGLLVVLHLGLIATALAYVLFARGLSSLLAATAVTLTLAEPLTAGILSVALLGEPLTPLALLGIGLLGAGLALLSIPGLLRTGRS